jgi:hypothetical protein
MSFGLIYEHWRLDTNECFYIGKAMGKDPYARANNLNRKDNSHHTHIVRKLKPLGLIEVRTSKFIGITKSALNNLERLSIAHWRMYIGKRLTNVYPGGEGAPSGDENPQKRPEARLRVSIQMTGSSNPMKNPETVEKVIGPRRGKKNPKVSGPNNGMYGKKSKFIYHTEETKEKMRGPKSPAHIKNSTEAQRLRRAKEKENGTVPRGWKNPGVQKRWDSSSDEDRVKHGKSTSLGLIDYYKNIPEDAYSNMCVKNKEKSRYFWDNITPQEYDNFVETQRSSMKDVWASMSDEERKSRGNKISIAKRKKTKEQRTESANKAWETRRRKKAEALAQQEAK